MDDKVNALDVIKGVAELVVSMGVGVVIGNLVKETTPIDATKIQKVFVRIGSYSLTGLLGDMAGSRLSGQIDTVANRINDAMNPKKADVVVYEKTAEENPEKDED